MKIEKNQQIHTQVYVQNEKNKEKNIAEKKAIEQKTMKTINLDKVNEIKQQIKSGTYKINPDAISEKILQDKKLLNKLMA